MLIIIIMISPTGWDINSSNLADACERARVLDIGIQDQLRPYLEKMKPRPSIYCQDFIAANQEERANNVLKGTKAQMMEQIRADIRDFKANKNLDKVNMIFTYYSYCIHVQQQFCLHYVLTML